MTIRLTGGAAAILIALLAVPALGQAPPAAPPAGASAPAPAGSDAARPSRRSRQKASGKPARQPSAGQLAARERQKKCAAEWKTAKADGKVEAGMKWPKFWSQCNTRLKAGAT